ncbi:hypothetical protein TNIN_59561, partial [Trichonephila inaurata madagascariensis]
MTKKNIYLKIGKGKLDEKASQLHAIASLRVLLDAAKANGGYPSGVNVPPAGGCCASCSQCPQCVTCPTCQRPLVRPTPAPQLDTATPLNTYIVTTSDYPPPHSPLSTIGGASASGAKRQGQDPLTNVQSLQSSTILNTLANGSASEHADRERHEETSFCTNTRSPVKTNAPTTSPVISTIMSESPNVTIIQPGAAPTAAAAAGDVQELALQAKSEEIEVDEPLDISWPKETKKRVSYVLMAPIIFPLWLTLPDVRRD